MRINQRWFVAGPIVLILPLIFAVYAAGDGDREEVRLGTFTTIDVPGATRSQARYLNSRGDIVGFYTAGGTVHGVLRSRYEEPTPIDFPGAHSTMAVGINSKGDIVGLYGVGGTTHGFLRNKDGSFSSLDFPDSTGTSAWGINRRGDIVGAYQTADGNMHGFIRDEDGRFSSFDVPDGSNTWPFAINSEGEVVGQYDAGGTTHGFVRNEDGRFRSFDVPGPINAGVGTQTRGITNRGDIVGWFVTSGGKRRGFLLSHADARLGEEREGQGQFTFIDFPGAIGTDTDGINSEGDMVGGYDGTDGKHHAYVLTRRERDEE
jgi:hypothetical protein